LSIGSLELLAKTPQTPEELETSLTLFAFSFFIIISIWFGYARIITLLSQETRGAISLNLLLLFFVVLEPYLFFVIQSSPTLAFLDLASVLYALDVGVMFLILAGLIELVLWKNTHKDGGTSAELHPAIVPRLRVGMIFYTLIGGIYLLSALPFFFDYNKMGNQLRFELWYSAFGFVFLGVVNRRREKDKHRVLGQKKPD